MHYQKHRTVARPNLRHPQRVPPLLSVFIDTIRTNKAQLVLQRLDSSLE